MSSLLELHLGMVARGYCWQDGQVLLSADPQGWRACTTCGRSFRLTPEHRAERIPVPEPVRGSRAAHSRDTWWVLATGDVVRADGRKVPQLALMAEYHHPPAPLPPGAHQ